MNFVYSVQFVWSKTGTLGGGEFFRIKWRGVEGGERGTKQCNKQMEYVARMEEMRKSANLKGRDHRTMHRYRDNIKMNRKGTGCEDWDSIRLAPVSIVMKLKLCYVQEIPLVERIFAPLHTTGSLVKSY